jgi:hypothetical protein
MSRLLAGLIALTATLALAAQWRVSAQELGQPGALRVLWFLAGFFTILTNTAVAAGFAAHAAGRALGGRLAGALTLAILLTGIVYHTLLAVPGLTGLALLADQGLHTAVPVLVLGWWLRFAAGAGVRWADLPVWLVWPVGYSLYALARQAVTGFVPYPFFDLARHGLAGVLGSGLGILALCLVIGAGLILWARRG